MCELRCRIHVGLNKGEAKNALPRAVFFNRLGELGDRAHENQPDNIYTALDNFRAGAWTKEILGEDVKGRYADLKQASADRCPRALGTYVKAPEIQYHHEVYNQFLWNKF